MKGKHVSSMKIEQECKAFGFALQPLGREGERLKLKPVTLPFAWTAKASQAAYLQARIDVPELVRQRAHLRLFLDRGDHGAQVFIDGQPVATPHSWNTDVYIDLAPYLAGEEASFELTLRFYPPRGKGKTWQGQMHHPPRLVASDDQAQIYRTDLYDIPAPSTLEQLGRHVFYCVYVRNFSSAGTFDGVREGLPWIKSLGADVLWLLPIHPIGIERRKGRDGSPYAIRDYTALNPELGDEDAFGRLVEQAHRMGMKLIIDCVLNHTSPDSVHVQAHPDWFECDAQGRPMPSVPDWSDVVDWDWSKEGVWNYCAQVMEDWVHRFDIDGFRCDVADLVPEDFWSQLRQRLDRIKPGILMLAESNAPTKHLSGFDLTYNESLYDTMVQVFAGSVPAEAIREVCWRSQMAHPAGAARLLFSENQDKQRALNAFGGPAQARLAAVLSVTLPGVPLLYTGTETGADAEREATFFDRSPVDFTCDRWGMRAFWTALLALRKSRPCLQTGRLEWIAAQPSSAVLAYRRVTGRQVAVVVANCSPRRVRVRLDPQVLGMGTLTLGPWQWSVF